MAAKKKPAKAKGPAKKGSKASAMRKPMKRGAAAKKAPKRTASKSTARSVSVGKKPFSKSEFIAELMSQTGLARKEVVAVLESISSIVGSHLGKSGPESFSWPGLFKIVVVKKPPTKARQGKNPFTGEMMMFKAKPASRKVKIRPLRQLKEMAA